MYFGYMSPDCNDEHVREIYNKLWTKTGLSTERLPLSIVDENVINAYNDGTKIVIYRGLVNSTKSWDEVALVLGHEIAHSTLRHLAISEFRSPDEIVVAESNADKMGAIYMMRAGYDVCKGREIMGRWLKDNGDYLNGDHPTYSYRYEQLNINCN